MNAPLNGAAPPLTSAEMFRAEVQDAGNTLAEVSQVLGGRKLYQEAGIAAAGVRMILVLYDKVQALEADIARLKGEPAAPGTPQPEGRPEA